MYCMGIVSPTAVQKHGRRTSAGRPVGTGPFKFVEWKTNTHVIIERNPDYWGDKALLDRVIFKVVPEEGARMIALQTGRRRHGPVPLAGPAAGAAQGPQVHRPRDDRHPRGLRRAARGHAAARRRARPAGAAARGRSQGHPRQHHGGLGGPGARRAGARRVRLQGHAARPALSRSIAPRPRRCWPRPAGRPAPTASCRRAGSGCRCRGWPRAAAIPRTARSPRPSRPCSRRSGSRPRCRSSSGPRCSSRCAATRSTTTCSRSAG